MILWNVPAVLLPILIGASFLAAAAPQDPGIGIMLASEADSSVRRPMHLLDTEYRVEVTGMLVNAEVTQHFANPSTGWTNARYVFPLSEEAAVRRLVVTIGGRRIEGLIKEKGEARETFEAAKRTGRQAALVEKHRGNLFSLDIANVAPGEAIEVELRYVDRVTYRDGRFSLRVPTTLTPRYIPGEPQDLAGTHPGWSLPTDVVPDADAITPPQVEGSDGHALRFQAHLDTGLPIDEVSSPHHAIEWTASANGLDVVLQPGATLDRDLELIWTPVADLQPRAALFTHAVDGEHYGLLMVTPPAATEPLSLPREVVYIIDTSGSMAGDSIRQARQALDLALARLSPRDRFNVIEFDSVSRALFAAPQVADEAGVAAARTFVGGLAADGGTEMYEALQMAFDQPTAEGFLRQIVFITDGAVGDEQRLFQLIDRRLGEARLFTVGIGSAPNAYFMRKSAQFGRGTYTFIGEASEVAERMGALFTRLESPLARRLQVDWPAGLTVESYPQRVPDLYAGEPLVLAFKSGGPVTAVTVSAQLEQGDWRETVRGAPVDNDALGSLWARDKVESLLDAMVQGALETEIQPQVLALGLRHELLTPYTSFVAVDEAPRRPASEEATDQAVPNLMPAGNEMRSLGFPDTATPAALYGRLALFLLLMAVLFAWRMRQCGRDDVGLEA